MSPQVSETMKRVVKDGRLCSNFAKLVSRPKVTLPKASTFNETVTLHVKHLDQSMCYGSSIVSANLFRAMSYITRKWTLYYTRS